MLKKLFVAFLSIVLVFSCININSVFAEVTSEPTAATETPTAIPEGETPTEGVEVENPEGETPEDEDNNNENQDGEVPGDNGVQNLPEQSPATIEDPGTFTIDASSSMEEIEEGISAFITVQINGLDEGAVIQGVTLSTVTEDNTPLEYTPTFDDDLNAKIAITADGAYTIKVKYTLDGVEYTKETTYVCNEYANMNALLGSEGGISTMAAGDSLKVYLQTSNGYELIDDILNASNEYEWDFGAGNNSSKKLLRAVVNFDEASRDQTRTVTINIPEGYRILEYSTKEGTDQIYSYNLDGTVKTKGDPAENVSAVTMLGMSDSENEGLVSSVLSVPDGDPFNATSNAYAGVPAGQEFGAQSAGKFDDDNYTYDRKYVANDDDGYEVRPGKLTYTFNQQATTAIIYVTIVPDEYTYAGASAKNKFLDSTVSFSDIENNTTALQTAITNAAAGAGQKLKDITVEMVSGDTTLNDSLTTRVINGAYPQGLYITPTQSTAVIDSETNLNLSGSNVSQESSIGLVISYDYVTVNGYSYVNRTMAKEVVVRFTVPKGVKFEYFAGPFISYLDTNGDGKADVNDDSISVVTDAVTGDSYVTLKYEDAVYTGGQHYSNTLMTSLTSLNPHFSYDGDYYMSKTLLDDTNIGDSYKLQPDGITKKATFAQFSKIELFVKPVTYGLEYTDNYFYSSADNPFRINFVDEDVKLTVYPRDTNKYAHNNTNDFPVYHSLSSIYVKNTGTVDTGEVQMVFEPSDNIVLKAMHIPVPYGETAKDFVVWASDGSVYTVDGRAVDVDLDGDGVLETNIDSTTAVPELADMMNSEGTVDFPSTKVDLDTFTDNGDRIYTNYFNEDSTIKADPNVSNIGEVGITRIQCNITNYPLTGNPIYASNYTGYKGVFYGFVTSGTKGTATMTMNKLNPNGSVMTQLDKKTANISLIANKYVVDACSSGAPLKSTYVTGETVSLYANALAYTNITYDNEYRDPDTYITVPDGFELDLSSIKIYQYYYTYENPNAASPNPSQRTLIDPSKYLITYDESKKTYKIEFIDKNTVVIEAGDYVNSNTALMRVYFNLQILPTYEETSGKAYNMQDIICFDTHGTTVTTQVRTGSVIKDKNNVTGNGTDYLVISPINTFSVVPLTDLVVKNGIRAKDSGDEFYYYNGAATSIALVNADHEAEIKVTWSNVSEQIYSNAEIYMPIPKKGSAWPYFFNNTVLSDEWNQTPENKDPQWTGYLVEEVSLPGFDTWYSIDAAPNGDLPTTESDSWVPVTATWIQHPTAAQLEQVNMIKFVSNGPVQPQSEGETIFRVRVSDAAVEDEYDFWRTLNSARISKDTPKRWSYGSVMAATPAAGTVRGKVFLDEVTNNGKLDPNENPYTNLQLVLTEDSGKIVPIIIPIKADGTFALTKTVVDENGVSQTIDRYLASGDYTLTIRNNQNSTVHFTKYVPTSFGTIDPMTGLPLTIYWGNDVNTGTTPGMRFATVKFHLPATKDNDPNLNQDTVSKYIGIGVLQSKKIEFDFADDADSQAAKTNGVTIDGTGIIGFSGETMNKVPTLANDGGYQKDGWWVYVDVDDDGNLVPVSVIGIPVFIPNDELAAYLLPEGKKVVFKGKFTPYTYKLQFEHSSLYQNDGGSGPHFSFTGYTLGTDLNVDYAAKPTTGPTQITIDHAEDYTFVNWSYNYVDANGITRQGVIAEPNAANCATATGSCSFTPTKYLDFIMYGRPDADKDTPVMLTANYAKKPYLAITTAANGFVDADLTQAGLAGTSTVLFDSVDLAKPLSTTNVDDGWGKYYPDSYYYLSKITVTDLYGHSYDIALDFDPTDGEKLAAGAVTTVGVGQDGALNDITLAITPASNEIHVTNFNSDLSSTLLTLEFTEYPKHNVLFYAWPEDNPAGTDNDVVFGRKDGIHETEAIGAVIPDAPTADGYTFVGWAKTAEVLSSTGTQTAVAYDPTTIMGNADQEYYAVWRKIAYEVTFVDFYGNAIDANGTDPGESQLVDYLDPATSPDKLPAPVTIPCPPGYTFIGWDKDFSSITGDLIVTAQYTRTFYKVTFYDHDDSVLSTATVGYGDPLVVPTITHTDYTFNAWYSDQGRTTRFNATPDYTVTSDLDIYAKCNQVVVNHTVIFQDFDGTLIDTQTVPDGGNATAPANPTRAGYDFVGWDTSYNNVTHDITVTAVYKETGSTKLTVTFVDHDGTVLKVETLDKGSNATAPTAPSHVGMNFVGWDTNYMNVQTDLTVTAQCAKNQYVVNYFDLNNVLVKSETVDYGDSSTPPTTPAHTGKTFVGWDKDTSVITSDLDVYATYNVNKYNVIYKVEDARGGEIVETQEIEHGTSTTPPTPPTKPGYSFTGWIIPAGTDLDSITGDVTIEAHYIKDPDPNRINVIFLDHDDTFLASVDNQVIGNSIAAAPVTPTNPHGDAYDFVSWDRTRSVTFPYVIPAGATNPIIIKAICKLVTHNVKFVTDDYDTSNPDPTKELKSEDVEHHGSATPPTPPVKPGYTFEGWDTDYSDVTGDIIVKPIYSHDLYLATFINDDGFVVSISQDYLDELITGPAADPTSGVNPAKEFLYFVDDEGNMFVPGTSVFKGNVTYHAVYKDHSSITPGGDRIGGNDFDHYIEDGGLDINKIIAGGSVQAFDKDGNPIPPSSLTIDTTELDAINTAITNGTLGTYPITFSTPDGTSITIFVTLKKKPVQPSTPNNPNTDQYLVTYLDCSGNTVKIEWVDYKGSSSAPGYGLVFDGAVNVTTDLVLKPNNCTFTGYKIPNTGNK